MTAKMDDRAPSVDHDPAASMAHLAAARLHLQAQRLDQALAEAKLAADGDPANTEAFSIWGVAAAELGLFADAIPPLQTAAGRARPGSVGWANLTSQLARAFGNVGFWAEAYRKATAVERLQAPDALVRHRLGALFASMGLVERALPHLEWAARAAPDRAEILFDLGVAYLSVGRSAEAEELLEKAIALAPLWPQPHMALSSLRRWTPADAHVERLTDLRAQPGVSASDRVSLGFTLFKELDDLGRYDEAWPILEEAHEAARRLEPAWSPDEDRALVDALIDRFPPSSFGRPLTAGINFQSSEPRTPIFVVGLPRSGTTLVERILSAHSKVVAIGEAPTFPILFRGASMASDRRELTAAVVKATGDADWPELARRYLAETEPVAGGAAFSVDKLPPNCLLIGALRLAFPRAPIVLLRREPMDTLFSVYRVLFSGAFRWSYRLEDMAAHYANHHRLMDHWRACLGDGLIEVSYEDLVTHPEAAVPRLLAACGLEFEENCLRPQDAAGSVRTASITQVRRPISAASVNGWRRYAEQLEPLRARLEALGVLEA